MSLPMSWSWLLTAEVTIMIVLVRRLLGRFSNFRSKRTGAPGWRRSAEAVIAVTSIGWWVSGWSRPPKESLSVLAGLALGCVIDELVQARTRSAHHSRQRQSRRGSRQRAHFAKRFQSLPVISIPPYTT